jgi:hypothetical protein
MLISLHKLGNEARLEDSETHADDLKDKLSERTIQYKDALKRIEELLMRIAELEEQVGSVSRQRRVGD